ncbi:MAG: type-4 uracil-DNA glycosylase [Thermofilaceae archaeon]|nr:type-4 uracil-DNA glycosylase [Thermofilaceae archaeon]
MCESRKAVLEAIAKEVMSCTKCQLHKTRTNAVPGEGNPCARVMLIGEAPGYNEDIQGRPFVGSAGNLLNQMLKIANMSREEVFITNVVKCRPPSNRDPNDEEIEACKYFLLAQIKAIKPEIIMCLGRHSTKVLLGLSGLNVDSIMRVRGELKKLLVDENEVICLPTLHPAAALYNPRLKSLLEADFRLLSTLTTGTRISGLDRWL